MGHKQNNMLASYEARLEARYQKKLDIAMQMGMDAGMIAANEVLSLGPSRAVAFHSAYIKAINEISRLLTKDGKDDPDLVYSTDVVDRRLKKIVGTENFTPWDERYGQ